ncbi:MAG: hypothetical protein NZ853_00560 [Leptospiraceae bacterium]|nr:hypothetical protein [Leptospiraceae bacterium]MDW7976281.1 hypothetical protein [Leptospiraceae bacterium]
MKLWKFFFFLLLLQCNHQKSEKLVISDYLFLYKNPETNEIIQSGFPIALIPTEAKVTHFLYLERMGFWSPEQYAIRLEFPHQNYEEVVNDYLSLLRDYGWQVLQSKQIKSKEKQFYFINAQDFFNRNLSVLIEKTFPIKVKMFIKKSTDE